MLVVDDNDAHAYVLSRLAASAGFKAREAYRGHAAIQIAKEDRPDAIVLDVRLPDIDGFEVCRSLKRDSATAHIPVLFVSSHFYDDVEEGRKLAREAGAEDLLTRAEAMDQLPDRLREMTARRVR